MMGWYGFGGAGIFGFLFMALFWIGLVLLLIWGIGKLLPRDRRTDQDVATEVLRRRYAAGEISEAEFRQAMSILEGRPERPQSVFTPDHEEVRR